MLLRCYLTIRLCVQNSNLMLQAQGFEMALVACSVTLRCRNGGPFRRRQVLGWVWISDARWDSWCLVSRRVECGPTIIHGPADLLFASEGCLMATSLYPGVLRRDRDLVFA